MLIEDFLAPHESRSGFTPHIVRADKHYVWWNGSEREAVTAILDWPFRGRTLHVRFEGNDTSFALTTAPSGNISASDFAPSRSNVRRRLVRAIHSARLWRRFSFAGAHPEVEHAAFVANGGVCQWVVSDLRQIKQQHQAWSEPHRFLIESANITEDAPLSLRARIEDALKNRNSDASFALAVAGKRWDWKTPTPWHKALQSTRSELGNLWTLVCRAHLSLSGMENGASSRSCGLCLEDWRKTRVEVVPDTPQLLMWAKVLLHFGPHSLVQTLPLQHLCVRDALGSVNTQFACWVRDVWSVSFHEQLEARMQLIEWARENLPTDVLREVLEQSE